MGNLLYTAGVICLLSAFLIVVGVFDFHGSTPLGLLIAGLLMVLAAVALDRR